MYTFAMKQPIIILVAVAILVLGGYLAWSQSQTDTVSPEGMIAEDNQVQNQEAEQKLENEEWVWLYTELQDGERVTAPEGGQFVISFDSETGRVTSRTDCNSLAGIFSANGEVLSMGEFISTKMYCEGSMEGVYAEQLTLVNSFIIEGEMLRLMLDRDYGVMVFKKISS